MYRERNGCKANLDRIPKKLYSALSVITVLRSNFTRISEKVLIMMNGRLPDWYGREPRKKVSREVLVLAGLGVIGRQC